MYVLEQVRKELVRIGQEEVRWSQDAEESFDMSVFFPHEEAEAELAYFIETLSTSRMCGAKAI